MQNRDSSLDTLKHRVKLDFYWVIFLALAVAPAAVLSPELGMGTGVLTAYAGAKYAQHAQELKSLQR